MNQCQQPAFSLIASSSIFCGHCECLQMSDLHRFLYMTWHSRRNVMPRRFDYYSDSKTDLNLGCDSYIKFQPFEGVQGAFSKLTVLHVTAEQRLWTAPRGMSVGPSVAVNIDFCGHFRLLCMSFVWSICPQCATEYLPDLQLVFIL
jgi:hypothetical protein